MNSLIPMPAILVKMSCLRTIDLLIKKRDQMRETFYKQWNKFRELRGHSPLTSEEAEIYFEKGKPNLLEYAGYRIISSTGKFQTLRLKSLIDLTKAGPSTGTIFISEQDFRTFKPGFDDLTLEAQNINKTSFENADLN